MRISVQNAFRMGQVPFVFALWMGAHASLSLAQEGATQPLSLTELVQEAVDKHPEVREARLRVEAVSHRASQAFSPFLPEVGLEGGYESWRSTQDPGDSLRGRFAYVFGRYNLFRGGQDRYRLLARSKEEEFARLALMQVEAKSGRRVASRFYQVLYLDQSLKLMEEALELNRAQVGKVEKRVRGGIVSRADVLEFNLRDASLQSDLILLKLDGEVAENELRLAIGRLDDSAIAVQGTLLSESAPKASAESLLKAAVTRRLDLMEAERDYDIASLEYAATLGEWLPQVNLEGNFGNLQPSEREVQGTPSSAIVLKITLPLFSGLSSYYERKAKSVERAQADARIAKLKLEVRTQLNVAQAKLRATQERLELEEKNVARAKEYYDITLSEYGRGVKNSPDLAGATERIFTSRQRLLDLQKEWQLARLELAEQIGAGADL